MKIGIAVDNTIPLHIPSLVEFFRIHSKTIHCHPINAPLRFGNTTIDYETEISKLSAAMRKELKGNDLSLLLTSSPFENNFFYEGRDHVFIISFSDWNLLTEPVPEICTGR